jgi:uncharacterized membrane protein
VATPLSRTSYLTTFSAGVGMLACVYLAALKLLNLPCPLSGCWSIINSRYGAVYGVPLPLLALPLWVALAFPATRSWERHVQLGSAVLLALGGLVLMVIQFFVLKGFCPYCTVHAVAAVLVAFVLPMRGRAHAWLPSLMLVLALPVFFAAKVIAEARLQSWDTPAYASSLIVPAASKTVRTAKAVTARASSMMALRANIDGVAFSWLGAIDDEESPILVVSFQCPHCLDLIAQVIRSPHFGSFKGPKVLLFSSPENSADTSAVLAAILSQPGTPQEQFAAVFRQLGVLFNPLVASDSKELRSRLGTLFPHYSDKLKVARQLLDSQAGALKYVPGNGTPFLLQPDGSGKYEISPNDLLFP